jgi:hypothetical protein
VAGEVANDLAAPHRVGYQRDLVQVERLDEDREIVGEGVVVVSTPGVVGATVAAPVIRHRAQTAVDAADHLVLPCSAAQRPGGAEHHGRAGAPVAIEERDLRLGSDEWHVRCLPRLI